MSSDMLKAVASDPLDDIPRGYRRSALDVFTHLAKCLNDKTCQCNPSIKTIAAAMHVSEDTVSRALAHLGKTGRISRKRRHSRSGWRQTDDYVLTPKGAISASPNPHDADLAYTAQCGSLTRTMRQPNPHHAGALEVEVKQKRKGEGRARENRSRFTPPSLAECREYAKGIPIKFDVATFHNHYTATGWKIGRSPMLDWQAAMRKWAGREQKDAMKRGEDLRRSRADYPDSSTDEQAGQNIDDLNELNDVLRAYDQPPTTDIRAGNDLLNRLVRERLGIGRRH